MTTENHHEPFLCRTHLHHHWVHEHNPDGEDYMRCSRCGKDRGEFDTNGGSIVMSNMPNGMGSM
jgi:hypothetical protein